MKQIFAIAKFTIVENISNKIFGGFILFGIFIMLMTVALKDLALYEDIKVIQDTGIFLTEFFVLIITIFVSSTQFLRDKKEKSIYLVLTKPVTRGMYITGKISGMVATVFFNMVVMALILAVVLVTNKAQIGTDFVLSFLFMFYKLSIVAALGIMFSVVSDSFITANIFTFSTYVAAHGIEEIKQIGGKIANPVFKMMIEGLYYILPNFRVLNYRDYIVPTADYLPDYVYKAVEPDILIVSLYFIGYLLCIGFVSAVIFSRKKI